MLPKVFLLGNLSSDPIAGVTNSGSPYCRFTVACSSNFSSKNSNTPPPTNFFQCTAWNASANFINNYLKKGDGIFVEGSLSINTYTNKDGRVIYNTNISAERVEVVNKRSARTTTDQFNQDNYGNYSSSKTDFNNFEQLTPPIEVSAESIVANTKIDSKLNNNSHEDENDEPIKVQDDDDDINLNEVYEKINFGE